ncbi:MAG: TetR/AcrR family transcriptional regulator [Ilumatobacteraceae bacterium]
MARAGLTSQRVVAEAALVADEVGLDQLTLAAVAHRFGVALPSLYKHITSLDGLRRDLAVLGMQQLAAALSRAAVGRSGKDALDAVAHAYREFATLQPGLYAATLRAPSPDDEQHTAVSQDALDVAIAVMRSYGIEGGEAVHAIRVFRSACHGFVAQEAAGSFGMPESIDESYQIMIDVLDVALASWKKRRVVGSPA